MNTNDYMNKVIRVKEPKKDYGDVIFRYVNGTLRVIPVDYAYHYGDLGKGRDTYYWNMESSNRSTGHFGTGTYFLSKEAQEEYNNYPFGIKNDRPLQKINFKDYNLFKVKNETDAYILHNGLKAVNYLSNLDADDFEHMREMFVRNGIDSFDISKAYYKARDTYYSPQYQNASYDSQLDSLSTVFMKELGYNGIDVRGISQYDNTTYGSVIYDLDKKKK